MKVSTPSHSPVRLQAPGRHGVWRRLLVLGTASSIATAPVAAAAGRVVGGPTGAMSALGGVALCGGFLLAGLLGLRLVLDAHDALLLPGVMSILAFQILGLMALWTESRKGGLALPAVDPATFGFGALATAVVWQVALVAVLMRTRQLVYPTVALPGDDGGAR